MKHILVPIGSSENSENTLQYSIDFAALIDAKIFVLRAYNPISKTGTIINIDQILEKESNLYLRSIIKSVDRKDREIKMISAKGDLVSSIASVDNEIGIDLVVMGPKSNSIREEVFLGPTAGSVIKKSNIPVLIVPEGYQFKPIASILTAFKSGVITKSKVLTPLNFFINTFKPSVDLLHVITPTHKEKDLIIDQRLDSMKTSLTKTENQTTFEGVLENFKTKNPDLLCVFRRKRGFFKKLWEKNIILKSEFNCTVPLLVLRDKK